MVSTPAVSDKGQAGLLTAINVGAWDSHRPDNEVNGGESAAIIILFPPVSGVTPIAGGREDPG